MIAGVSAGDLKPPVLLLAMPQVQDPFFHKSVVLLLAWLWRRRESTAVCSAPAAPQEMRA